MCDVGLNVQMFGGFQVSYGEAAIVSRGSRNSKVVQLLAYMLNNRNRMITQDELVEVLLSDEDDINPFNTLKNIVYRLRKLLAATAGDVEFIIYKKGSYGFVTDIPCHIDVEQFMALVQSLDDFQGTREALFERCLEAINIYKGDLLSSINDEPWIIAASVRYQEIFVDCIGRAYDLALDHDWLERLVEPLQRACTLYPYEESLYLMYITCLYELKRVKEAIAKYESVVTMLFNDLGIGPSDNLRDLYKRVTGDLEVVTESVADVRTRISESDYERGAYFCNYESFSEIYHFVVRHMERSGQNAFLMLSSVTELDGSQPEGGERLRRIATALQQALRISCRRGDVCARYSSSQYLLMLMNIRQEHCAVVSDRLRYNFYKFSKINNVRLDNKVISAVDIESVMKAIGVTHPPLEALSE